jgi:hypothetical protein
MVIVKREPHRKLQTFELEWHVSSVAEARNALFFRA